MGRSQFVRCPGLDNPKVPCQCLEASTLAVHRARTRVVHAPVSSPCTPVGWKNHPPLHTPASCTAHLSARPATPWPLWGCASNCRGCAESPPPRWGALARWPGCHSSHRAACPASGMVGGRVAPPECFGVAPFTASNLACCSLGYRRKSWDVVGSAAAQLAGRPGIPAHPQLHQHNVVSTRPPFHALPF